MMALGRRNQLERSGFRMGLFLTAGSAFAFTASPQAGDERGPVGLLAWVLLFGLPAFVYFGFHQVLYPKIRSYYRSGSAKVIFIPIVLIFMMTAIYLSQAVVEEALLSDWLRWVAAFVSVVALLWFLIALLRSR